MSKMSDKEFFADLLRQWKELRPSLRGRAVTELAGCSSGAKMLADKYASIRSDAVDEYREKLVENSDALRIAAALLDVLGAEGVGGVRMIPAEKLAEWKALAEAGTEAFAPEGSFFAVDANGRVAACVGEHTSPEEDCANAALFAAARPAILALVAEVDRLQGEALGTRLRGLVEGSDRKTRSRQAAQARKDAELGAAVRRVAAYAKDHEPRCLRGFIADAALSILHAEEESSVLRAEEEASNG